MEGGRMKNARSIICKVQLRIFACSLLLLFAPCLWAQVVEPDAPAHQALQFTVQLLGNPSFEEWVDDGEPGEWKFGYKRISKSDDGMFATEIRLLPGDKATGIDQILSIDSSAEGAIVQASIRCNSEQPEVLDFALYLVVILYP
jgi:hypothetical protein